MKLKLLSLLIAIFFLPEAHASVCGLNITAPAGAKVYISGEYIGDVPLVHITGVPGLFKVRVEKEGYTPWEEYVDVPLNVILELAVTLVPIEPPEAKPGDAKATEEVQAKPVEAERGVCGPTALLALAVLPLAIRSLHRRKR